MRRKITTSIVVLYALGVIGVTQFPIHRHPPGYWAGQPWWTVIHWIPGDVDAPSFVLNVIMFIPYGILVPLLHRTADRVRRLARAAVVTSSGIELTQLVLGLTLGSRRTVDVNDLIANTAGALLGLFLLRLALPHPAHWAWVTAPASAGLRARAGPAGRPDEAGCANPRRDVSPG
jgi:glycopeptide antibiotics resistance protein